MDSNHSLFDFVIIRKIYLIDKYKMAKNDDRMYLDLEEYIKTYKGRNILRYSLLPFKLDQIFNYPHIERSGLQK